MPILYEYNTLKENISLAKKLNLDFIELNLNFGYLRDELENNKKSDEKFEYNSVLRLENISFEYEKDKAHVFEYEVRAYVIEDEEFVEKQTAIFIRQV